MESHFLTYTAHILHFYLGGSPSHNSTGQKPLHSFVTTVQGMEADSLLMQRVCALSHSTLGTPCFLFSFILRTSQHTQEKPRQRFVFYLSCNFK